MLWLGWLAANAVAAPCADLPTLTEQGWAAFYDAELERSREIVVEANSALGCQPDVVARESLLALYRLDALVSVSQEDRKSAMYATIRMVTLDPEAAPDDELGPVIAELHETWSSRLAETTVKVTESGAGEAFIDGAKVPDGGLVVVEGEHLVQVRQHDGTFSSELREIAEALAIETGGEVAVPPETQGPGEPTTPAEPKADDPKPERPPKPPKEPGKHRVGLLATSGVLIAAGAGGATYAWSQERAFLASSYTPDAFGDCQRLEPCYPGQRRSAIIADAKEIRLMYGVSYGVAAAGVLLLGTELVVLPAPTAGGGGLVLHTEW